MTDPTDSSLPAAPHVRSPRLLFVFITLLIDVLGIGLIIPVGPQLVAAVMGLSPENEKLAAVPYGWLIATYAIMQFIFAPILGSLSDRFGRRPVILISLAGSAVDYLAGALVLLYCPMLSLLFITRALNGISGANITACSAYIADVTPPEKRSAAFGLIGAAFGLGFVIGPLAGGFLGDPDVSLPLIGPGRVYYPYIAAAILCAVNWCYGYFVLPESLPKHNRRSFSWRKANPFGAFKWLTGHPVVITLVAALFLLNIAQFALHATWNLSMRLRFHWGSEDVGLSLFTVGITAAIVQGFLARKIIPVLGERLCLLLGVIMAVAAFTGYGLAPEAWMIYVIISIASLGGVSQAAVQGIMSKAIPPTEQGLLQGAIAGLQSIANIAGPLVGSRVFEYYTSDHAPRRVPGAPFLLGAMLCAFALIPIALVWKRLPSRVKEVPDESSM